MLCRGDVLAPGVCAGGQQGASCRHCLSGLDSSSAHPVCAVGGVCAPGAGDSSVEQSFLDSAAGAELWMKMLFALGGCISCPALGSPQFCSSPSHPPPSPQNIGILWCWSSHQLPHDFPVCPVVFWNCISSACLPAVSECCVKSLGGITSPAAVTLGGKSFPLTSVESSAQGEQPEPP